MKKKKYARKKNGKGLIVAIVLLSGLLAALIGFVIFMEFSGSEDAPSAEFENTIPATTSAPETEGTVPDEEASSVPAQTDPEIDTTGETPTTSPTQGKDEDETIDNPTVPETEDVTEDVTEAPAKDLMVSTSFCNLYYPAEWSHCVRADVESTAVGCIVSFYGTAGGREVELFTVYFAESGDNSFPVGTLSHEGTMIDVSAQLSDFQADASWKKTDAEDISAMQEGINYLVSKLNENSAFSPVAESTDNKKPEGETPSGEKTTVEEPEAEIPTETTLQDFDLAVPTPYCELYYPGQWKDAVRYECEQTEIGCIVVFYGTVNGKEAELFTVYFAESSETSVPVGIFDAEGMLMDISIDMPKLADDTWNENEEELFYGLQEKINYLLEKLQENAAFSAIEE